MSGLVKVGTGAGQLLFPLIATLLIATYSWRNAFLIIGAFALVVLILLAQILRRDPKDMNLLPDGEDSDPIQNTASHAKPSLPIRTVIGTSQFWIICVAEFTIFFCLLTTIVHIIPHARDTGLPPATAAAVLSTIGGVSMLGRFVMGTANDHIGGKRSLIICLMLLITSLVLLQVDGAAWLLFLFAVIYGFAHGALFTVISPFVAELFGTGSHGALFGIILFCGTLGGFGGTLAGGLHFRRHRQLPVSIYYFDRPGRYRLRTHLLPASFETDKSNLNLSVHTAWPPISFIVCKSKHIDPESELSLSNLHF